MIAPVANPLDARCVLVMGATGYIGKNTLGPLVAEGYRVRAAARNPARIPGPENIERVAADVSDAASIRAALVDVQVAFYFVHTLGGGADYQTRDRDAARIFGEEAALAGVERIVYLGGLGEDRAELSEHLASRHEVGRLLAAGGVPVIEFRASIVIGSGSTSFEMIRNLVEKLPAMTTPRWVRMPAQPVGIDDVVAYLLASIELGLAPDESHRVYEIGGADITTYGGLLALHAELRDLKRLVIPVPVLSPGLSGWWLYLFTPREATVGRQLAESLRFPTVVTDDSAARDFPDIHPIGTREAVMRAFAAEDAVFDRTLWAEEFAGDDSVQQFQRNGRYVDSRVIRAACPPEAAFDPVACIGGKEGWYAYDTLWDLRGFIDILLGGPGRRRGRRDQFALVEGDHLDWWRVERLVAPRLLRLVAEMKLPGRGWLQYELRPDGDETIIRQTAIYEPKGVLGRAYWYLVLPMHHFVFNGTLKGIDTRCRELVEGPNTCPLPDEYGRQLAKRQER